MFPDQRVARYNLAAWQNPESDSVYFIGREVALAGAKGQPDTGILKLFEINDEDNGRNGKQVEQVNTDRKPHHVSDENKPAIGARTFFCIPSQNCPENNCSEE